MSFLVLVQARGCWSLDHIVDFSDGERQISLLGEQAPEKPASKQTGDPMCKITKKSRERGRRSWAACLCPHTCTRQKASAYATTKLEHHELAAPSIQRKSTSYGRTPSKTLAMHATEKSPMALDAI